MLRTLGFWGCNIPSSKLVEVLGYLKGNLTNLEMSEGKSELKKTAIKAIVDIFHLPERDQEKML
jgi:hypothetical protein